MESSNAGMADSSSYLTAELTVVSELLGQSKNLLVVLFMRGQTNF